LGFFFFSEVENAMKLLDSPESSAEAPAFDSALACLIMLYVLIPLCVLSQDRQTAAIEQRPALELIRMLNSLKPRAK